MQIILALSVFILGVPMSPNSGSGDRVQDWDSAAATLVELTEGLDASMVLYDMSRDQYWRYNRERCGLRLPPCSTFKIFNALVGLETGVLADQGTRFTWDGRVHWNKGWNRDHDLASAVKHSVVWYFQEVAKGVGKVTMQGYLDRVGYGNRDLSAGIDRFWLGSSLTISADEQVTFLASLYRNELPFSVHAMEATRAVLVYQERPAAVLSGKTGSNFRDDSYVLGWYVGHLISPRGEFVFALNLEGPGAKGPTARKIILRLLEQLGLWGS